MSTKANVKNNAVAPAPNSIILSKNHYLNLDRSISGLNSNVLAIGSAGTGKSYAFVRPNLKQMNGNYVVTDCRNELYKYVADDFKKKGYKVEIIDFKNVSGAHYNPFQYLNTESIDTISHDIKEIVDIIITETELRNITAQKDTESDSYLTNFEKVILEILMLHTYVQHGTSASFVSLIQTLKRLADAEDLYAEYKLLLDEIEAKYPCSQIGKTASEKHAYVTVANLSFKNVIVSLAVRLTPFQYYYVDKNHARKTRDELDLKQLLTKKYALFINFSDYDLMMRPLEAVLMYQIIRVLMTGGKNNMPVQFVLDEFSNFGEIPDFDKVMSVSSFYNMSFLVMIQSFEQLKHVYKEKFATIMNCFDTIVNFGIFSPYDIDYLLKLYGNEIIVPEPSQKLTLGMKLRLWLKEKIVGTENMHYVRAFRAEELRQMDMKYCIVSKRGEKPVLDEKYWPDKK